MAAKRTKRGPGRRGGRSLTLPEEVLSRIAAPENLPEGTEGSFDLKAALALDMEIAAGEIAQALVETGRPLGHLHTLRLSVSLQAFRAGYAEGIRAVGSVCNALAHDVPPATRSK